MPENLYPNLPIAPFISQERFNIDTIRKYHQDIVNLKNKFNKKAMLMINYYMHLQVQVLLV